jgi:Na+-translocating ferredoxin:NAD+ oxidoreductase subunit B
MILNCRKNEMHFLTGLPAEDLRIDLVEGELPAANCGACGYATCRNLAEAIVKAKTLDGLSCTIGGNEVMVKITKLLGRESA